MAPRVLNSTRSFISALISQENIQKAKNKGFGLGVLRLGAYWIWRNEMQKLKKPIKQGAKCSIAPRNGEWLKDKTTSVFSTSQILSFSNSIQNFFLSNTQKSHFKLSFLYKFHAMGMCWKQHLHQSGSLRSQGCLHAELHLWSLQLHPRDTEIAKASMSPSCQPHSVSCFEMQQDATLQVWCQSFQGLTADQRCGIAFTSPAPALLNRWKLQFRSSADICVVFRPSQQWLRAKKKNKNFFIF